jgi:tetratricopeptide (TPR) repeat protein
MRFLAAILVLCVVNVSSSAVWADQNAPQLDELFQQLREAPDEVAARQIEQRIWALWVAHEESAVNGLMEIGIGQMAYRNYPSALESFEEMVGLVPEFAEAWNKRATVHWLLGNYQDSLSDIDKTLALEPRHFGALSGRGQVYVDLEEWDLALKAFEDALEVYPQMVGPRLNSEAIRLMLEGRPI